MKQQSQIKIQNELYRKILPTQIGGRQMIKITFFVSDPLVKIKENYQKKQQNLTEIPSEHVPFDEVKIIKILESACELSKSNLEIQVNRMFATKNNIAQVFQTQPKTSQQDSKRMLNLSQKQQKQNFKVKSTLSALHTQKQKIKIVQFYTFVVQINQKPYLVFEDQKKIGNRQLVEVQEFFKTLKESSVSLVIFIGHNLHLLVKYLSIKINPSLLFLVSHSPQAFEIQFILKNFYNNLFKSKSIQSSINLARQKFVLKFKQPQNQKHKFLEKYVNKYILCCCLHEHDKKCIWNSIVDICGFETVHKHFGHQKFFNKQNKDFNKSFQKKIKEQFQLNQKLCFNTGEDNKQKCCYCSPIKHKNIVFKIFDQKDPHQDFYFRALYVNNQQKINTTKNHTQGVNNLCLQFKPSPSTKFRRITTILQQTIQETIDENKITGELFLSEKGDKCHLLTQAIQYIKKRKPEYYFMEIDLNKQIEKQKIVQIKSNKHKKIFFIQKNPNFSSINQHIKTLEKIGINFKIICNMVNKNKKYFPYINKQEIFSIICQKLTFKKKKLLQSAFQFSSKHNHSINYWHLIDFIQWVNHENLNNYRNEQNKINLQDLWYKWNSIHQQLQSLQNQQLKYLTVGLISNFQEPIFISQFNKYCIAKVIYWHLANQHHYQNQHNPQNIKHLTDNLQVYFMDQKYFKFIYKDLKHSETLFRSNKIYALRVKNSVSNYFKSTNQIKQTFIKLKQNFKNQIKNFMKKSQQSITKITFTNFKQSLYLFRFMTTQSEEVCQDEKNIYEMYSYRIEIQNIFLQDQIIPNKNTCIKYTKLFEIFRQWVVSTIIYKEINIFHHKNHIIDKQLKILKQQNQIRGLNFLKQMQSKQSSIKYFDLISKMKYKSSPFKHKDIDNQKISSVQQSIKSALQNLLLKINFHIKSSPQKSIGIHIHKNVGIQNQYKFNVILLKANPITYKNKPYQFIYRQNQLQLLLTKLFQKNNINFNYLPFNEKNFLSLQKNNNSMFSKIDYLILQVDTELVKQNNKQPMEKYLLFQQANSLFCQPIKLQWFLQIIKQIQTNFLVIIGNQATILAEQISKLKIFTVIAIDAQKMQTNFIQTEKLKQKRTEFNKQNKVIRKKCQKIQRITKQQIRKCQMQKLTKEFLRKQSFSLGLSLIIWNFFSYLIKQSNQHQNGNKNCNQFRIPVYTIKKVIQDSIQNAQQTISDNLSSKIRFDHCDRVKFRFRVFAIVSIKENQYCEHFSIPHFRTCASKIMTKMFQKDIFENENRLNSEQNRECVIRTNEMIKIMDHLSLNQKEATNQSTKLFSKNIIQISGSQKSGKTSLLKQICRLYKKHHEDSLIYYFDLGQQNSNMEIYSLLNQISKKFESEKFNEEILQNEGSAKKIIVLDNLSQQFIKNNIKLFIHINNIPIILIYSTLKPDLFHQFQAVLNIHIKNLNANRKTHTSTKIPFISLQGLFDDLQSKRNPTLLAQTYNKSLNQIEFKNFFKKKEKSYMQQTCENSNKANNQWNILNVDSNFLGTNNLFHIAMLLFLKGHQKDTNFKQKQEYEKGEQKIKEQKYFLLFRDYEKQPKFIQKLTHFFSIISNQIDNVEIDKKFNLMDYKNFTNLQNQSQLKIMLDNFESQFLQNERKTFYQNFFNQYSQQDQDQIGLIIQ